MSLKFRIALVLGVTCILGCVSEIKDLKDFPEHKAALEFRKAAKSAEEKAAMEAVKKRMRIEGRQEEREIFDPWLPPAEIANEKLLSALQGLPKDVYGYPDWTAAVRKGLLNPINSLEQFLETRKMGALLSEGSMEAAELAEKYMNAAAPDDIIFEINDRLMFNVTFSHRVHTYWLSCEICHSDIFEPEKGANDFSMNDIWDGEYCGRCHGKVAFQPKGYDNCRRCHNSRKKTMGVR